LAQDTAPSRYRNPRLCVMARSPYLCNGASIGTLNRLLWSHVFVTAFAVRESFDDVSLLQLGISLRNAAPARARDNGAEETRIACVGDSLTEGSRGGFRGAPYPEQLQAILGSRYNVSNFGHGGSNTTKYKSTAEFDEAISYNANIVVIMFGTNDVKHSFQPAEFEMEYSALIDSFLELPTSPLVFLVVPPPIYAPRFIGQTSISHSDRVRSDIMLPPLEQALAEEHHLPGVVDAHSAFKAHCPDIDAPCDWMMSLPTTADQGVHPTYHGASVIARLVSETILRYRGPTLAPQVDPSFNGKMPIEFVHVPKCGSSFLSTLIHIKGACENLPKNEDEITVTITTSFLVPPSWKCNTSVLGIDIGTFGGHHYLDMPEKGGFEARKGRFMIMLRQPEQRLLSAINYNITRHESREANENDLQYYMETHSGAATKMLSRTGGRWKNPTSDPQPPTRAEVETAKSRLRTGFSFIGITDQWDLSICLFNTMFNQTCRSFQFQNSRPTSGNSTSLYDTTTLKGWRDPYDGELYAVGLQTFASNLKEYNVSESSCEPCWREAGLL